MIEDTLARAQSNAFLLAMVALAACLLSFGAEAYTQRDQAGWVAHSREVTRQARELRGVVAERHGDVLQHLLFKDASALADERALREPMLTHVSHLDSLTTDNPDQHARAVRIRRRVADWDTLFAAPVTQRSATNSPGDRAADARIGRELYRRVSTEIAAFLGGEEQLYLARVDAEHRTRRIITTTIPVEILLLGALLLALRNRLAAKTQRIAAQKDAIAERNAQLATQAEQLGLQNEELRVHTEELQTQAIALEEQTAEVESALDELRVSEERFRTLVASLPDVVSTMDSSGRIDALLGTWVEREKVNPQMLLGRTPAEYFGEEIGELHTAASAKALQGESVVFDWNTEPGEDQRFFTTSLAPLRDHKSSVVGIVSVCREITQRHKQQVELQSTLDRLRHAQKLEAIGQLAGGVAHDFNNILTIILAYSDVLAIDMVPDAREREPLEEIRFAATRAAAVTRQLLSFSRRQELHPRAVSLNDVISGVQKLIERLAGPEVELSVNLAPGIGQVMSDPGQLEQVIMNLVVNARDAMPTGGRLTIETMQLDTIEQLMQPGSPDGIGSFAVLRVRDAGTGMSEDTKARLFEPFFTTKDVGKGTGLGLATVYGIIEQAKGQIRVESALGRGTTFTIYLPTISAAKAEAPQIPHGRTTTNERLLIVDDDDAVRMATARLLRGLGYDVLESSNAADALDALEAAPGTIGIVITDLAMPDMSGSELANEILLRYPECAVVIFSGYTRGGALESLRDRVVVVDKPFTLETLMSGVREAQRRKQYA